MLLVCDECRCVSDDEARGWVAFLGEDTDGIEPTTVATYCPECAAEEFGYKAEQAVERTFAWLHHCKRLLVRYDRRHEIHEAFLALACCLVCFRRLQPSF